MEVSTLRSLGVRHGNINNSKVSFLTIMKTPEPSAIASLLDRLCTPSSDENSPHPSSASRSRRGGNAEATPTTMEEENNESKLSFDETLSQGASNSFVSRRSQRSKLSFKEPEYKEDSSGDEKTKASRSSHSQFIPDSVEVEKNPRETKRKKKVYEIDVLLTDPLEFRSLCRHKI